MGMCVHCVGRVFIVLPIHAVIWVNHANDLDGHPRSCEVPVVCFAIKGSFADTLIVQNKLKKMVFLHVF